ncbi:uncharacterized protein LOC107021936 [Solanum pennellii]|uniref:Uncharacterized protein LOC107021936 n=1 Tax=Solanum pennellii TaxID=28526 RepID=A0ABM1GZG1_SOLPN|nr:uncharacterized protein LOC107021936 [Solanum pennellii]
MIPLVSPDKTTTKDPENFIEELKKVYKVMHVFDDESVELDAYKLKGVDRTWFNQWKDGRAEDAPHQSWSCFEEAFLGKFFPLELRESKKGRSSRPQLQKSTGHEPSTASAHVPKNGREHRGHNSQHFKVRPAISRCGRIHPGKCHDGYTGCFNCGQEGYFMRECPNNKEGGETPGNSAQSSSVSPPNRAAPRGVTSGTGGGKNRLYAIITCQEQENYLDIITGMNKVFTFYVYVLLDHRSSLSLVPPYVTILFEILHEKLRKPFSVSTHVRESILEERVYHDCPVSINHKSTGLI